MHFSSSKSDLNREDRRHDKRGRAFKTGKLIYGGASPTVIDCFVIELSENGARVETGAMTHIPEVLVFRLSDNTDRRVRRAWAIGNQIGLQFMPTE